MNPVLILSLLASMFTINVSATSVIDISLDELNKQLKSKPETVVLDIRNPKELRFTGTINHRKSFNISRGWLETKIASIVPDKSTPVVVYCGKNIRSPLAAQTLTSLGYSDVKNFKDGVFAWEKAGQKMWYYGNQKDKTSILYSSVKKVAEDVYTSIGAVQPGSYENFGHNNNLSFIVGDDAVVVFNAGGSYLLAEAFHHEIKKITDKPVKYVIYENAQFHAVFGSPYWKSIGATIIAQENFKEHNPDTTIAPNQNKLGNHFFKSGIVMPDIYFKDSYKLPLKGKNIELKYFGPAHGQEDALLWMPDTKLLISGDFAFNERLFPVFKTTDLNAWIESWEKMESLEPLVIIPGHGDVTDLDTATKYTMGYANHLKKSIENLLDEDGELGDIYLVDSSEFYNHDLFKELHLGNLEKVFKRFEFEY
jgi:rhodanese-related sulfurtransferase/glyoxylase-like metal-dependent hydrolase (beta-lactamase superfamily II)